MSVAAPTAHLPRRVHWLLWAGLGVMAVALAWWLAYYAPMHGAFALLGEKYRCIAGDTVECGIMRDTIGDSAIPVYSPLVFWIGLIFTLVGLYVTRRNRA